MWTMTRKGVLPTRFAVTAAAAAAAATIIAAATAATPASTAAATSTKTAATSTTAAAATATIFAWSGFIDGEVATIQILTIKLFDRCFRFFLSCHLDETKSAGTTGLAVFDYGRRLNRACLRKELLQFVARSLKRKVTDVQFRGHVEIPLLRMLRSFPSKCASE
jgi:hypothetical protein